MKKYLLYFITLLSIFSIKICNSSPYKINHPNIGTFAKLGIASSGGGILGIPTTNLIALYIDGLTDYSGNGYNATSGAAGWGSAGTPPNSQAGNCITFDGTGWIALNTNAALYPTDVITICQWYYATNDSVELEQGNSGVGNRTQMSHDTNSNIFGNNGTPAFEPNYFPHNLKNGWHCKIGIFDGSHYWLIIDNVIQGYGAASGALGYSSNIGALGATGGGTQVMNGSQWYIAIYHGALTTTSTTVGQAPGGEATTFYTATGGI